MFKYTHYDGREGTGDTTWKAIIDAIGAEADNLVFLDLHWLYLKEYQVGEPFKFAEVEDTTLGIIGTISELYME